MSEPTVSVAPDATLWAAWTVMMQSGVRHLLVASGDLCLGMLDDRTLFAEWPMGPLALRRRTVRDLVRPSTTCVLPDADLQTVARALVEDSTDAIPVVSVEGRLLGIITGGDLVRAVAEDGLPEDCG